VCIIHRGQSAPPEAEVIQHEDLMALAGQLAAER
jgi:hypothetical protein